MKFICGYDCSTTICDDYKEAMEEFGCANCPKERRECWSDPEENCLGFPTPSIGPFGIDEDEANKMYEKMKKELLK